MVLSRASTALLLVGYLAGGLAGCGESLFDANGKRRDAGTDDGGGDGGGGDGDVPDTCPDTCLADAAADLDKASSSLRYLEEGPSHAWFEMSRSGAQRTGTVDMNNVLERCSPGSSMPACAALPGALLVTPAGDSSQFFPAIEFKSLEAQVLHLIVRAHVPSGGPAQDIRLYRNGREDVLFTSRLQGSGVETDIVVDALPGDRFLVAVKPTGAGGVAALHFFVSKMTEGFPVTCQLAAAFEAAPSNVVADLCTTGRSLASMVTAGPVAPILINTDPPFTEQGNFARFPSATPYFFQAAGVPLDRTKGGLTTQFWIRVSSFTTSDILPAVDDFNLDFGGGSTFGFLGGGAPQLEIRADTELGGGVMPGRAAAPFSLNAWRFVRMVETAGTLKVCLDGSTTASASLPIASDRPPSDQTLHVAKLSYVAGADMFKGDIDDLRVFAGALPCE